MKTLLLLTLVTLIPAALSAQSDPLGAEWNGTDDGSWDFRMVRDGSSPNFSYEATSRTNNRTVKGTVVVDLFRRKLKLTRTVNGFATICDGMFSGDGRFVSGVCYGAQQETYWWATVQKAPPGLPPPAVNINTATVRELETWLGLDPVLARQIVEAKLKLVAFSSTSNLIEGNIVPADVYDTIKAKITVR